MFRLVLLLSSLSLIGCTLRNAPPEPKPWHAGLDASIDISLPIALIGIVASIAILVWTQVPALSKWAWLSLIFWSLLLVADITLSIIIPWIPYIIIGGIAIGVGIIVYYLIKHPNALRDFVANQETKIKASTANLVTKIKQDVQGTK